MNARLVKDRSEKAWIDLIRVIWLALVLLLSGLLTSCGQAPGVEGIGSGYDVRENNDATWASINVLNPLDALNPNTWSKLVPNGMVTTNDAGVAELRNTSLSCSGLYVFRNSGVQLGSCSQNMAGNWICVVGAAASTGCNVGLLSPSTTVTTRGTWVSLMTVDNGEMSIVTVITGTAEVVPVVQLDYQYEIKDDHSLILTFNQRVLDEKQTVRLGPGESTYTASDDYLALHAPNITIRARTRLDQLQFQSLIEQLLPLYPLLPSYLEDVRWRATMDNMNFPAALEREIFLQGQGGFLADYSQQQVVLLGVDWKVVQKDVSTAQPVSLVFRLPGREGLMANQIYDLDTSRRIIDQGSLRQNPILLLIPPGDEDLRITANSMADAFKTMGIPLNVSEVAPDEWPAIIDNNVKAGMPVLWLEWR